MPAPDYATEIAALEAGMASGEARVESDGDVVVYRGVSDIMAALTYFRSKASAAAGTLRRGGATFAVFDRD
jgi:hypothetical protein